MVDEHNPNNLPERNDSSKGSGESKNLQNSDADKNLPSKAETDKKEVKASEASSDLTVPDGYVLPDAGTDEGFQADMPIALLEFHSPTAAVINMPPTASAQYITWLIGGLAIFSFLGMWLFPLDKVVTTDGRLVSTDNTLIVQPLDSSFIRSVDVKEGDFVRKGQVLAHLDPTITEADVENLRLQTQSFHAEYDRLVAEASNKDYAVDLSNPSSVEQASRFLRRKLEYNAKVDDFNNQIAEQKVQRQSFLASAAMYRGRMQVASDVHEMRRKLQKEEVGSRLMTLSAQDNLMEMERNLISSQQSANGALNRINSLEAQREAYIQNWKADVYKELVIAQRELSRNEGDYTKAKLRRSKILLRAEQDAIVLSIAKGSVGSVLNAGVPFINLVPVGTGLEVEAAVGDTDVGYLHLGDKALIKFSTFPYTQYGGAEAVVRNISADVFQPGDMSQETNRRGVAPLQFRERPFYRVRLRITRYTLHDVPNFFHPTPGLIVTADIHVGKRTIMQYLLNSMIPTLSNGMRDPQ